MAKITDPDLLNQATEVIFNTTTRTVALAVAGNLSTDGVSLQALYSFCKEEWKNDSNLIKYPFPLEAITPEMFEFKNGWIPANQTTINLLRDAGFAIKNTDGSSAAEYVGVITLGSIGATDQIYYQQATAQATSNLVLTGPSNQAVCMFSAKSTANRSADLAYITGDFNYRSYLKLFVREYQKQYAQSQLSDIGVGTLTYQAYRFPLSNSADLKITHNDAAMAGAPYTGIDITYFATDQSRTIGGVTRYFRVIVDGNGATAEQIYEKIQYSLRQNSDIDEGAASLIGKSADSLLRFVGDTLYTSQGVFIDNFAVADTNRIKFIDQGGTERTFPYVATGVINFNDNLVADGGAVFRMYYTSEYGSAGASPVLDNASQPISGAISGGQIAFTYDYDGNAAGGGAGIDKAVTVVAIGITRAQFVLATGTITRSTANAVSLSAALERNYSNL